ncbi:type II toxin-antitoxin system HicB family antitoxin [Sulfuricurvum sp.]|uniref:type II toxin-antitoxin system HicB family antitoxin n=1 Tax=Sulfuricurvum sp. TaxID=2025608 RepID=UPI003BB63EE2
MNNYVITNHAKQRRPHYPIRSDEELKEIMSRLDIFYNFSSLEDGKYYFQKKGKAAVFKKDRNTVTLITIRGINLETEINDEIFPPLKIDDPIRAEKREKRKATRDIKHKWMQYYPAVLEETEAGGYSIFFPDVPGCISSEQNLEKAISMSKKAIAVHLTGMVKNGDPLPAINLNRCKEAAKGHILVMVRPQKELLIIKQTDSFKNIT